MWPHANSKPLLWNISSDQARGTPSHSLKSPRSHSHHLGEHNLQRTRCGPASVPQGCIWTQAWSSAQGPLLMLPQAWGHLVNYHWRLSREGWWHHSHMCPKAGVVVAILSTGRKRWMSLCGHVLPCDPPLNTSQHQLCTPARDFHHPHGFRGNQNIHFVTDTLSYSI